MSSLSSFVVRFLRYLRWCKQGGYTQIALSQIKYPDIMSGKKVLVTGGSDGIGLAIAQKFLAAGAEVMITGRNEEKLCKVEKMISSEKLHILQWDVSDMTILNDKLAQVVNTLNGIDVLVNNAAYLAHFIDSREFFDNTMDTNVRSVYFMCKCVGEKMHQINGQKGGHIINISSINSYQADIHPYYVSKRAVNAITEGFAKKYAKLNIIVNAIAPGYCDSSINRQNANENAYWPDARNSRITIPSEIAEIAMFLCSGAVNGIIGQTIVCDGGTLLQ